MENEIASISFERNVNRNLIDNQVKNLRKQDFNEIKVNIVMSNCTLIPYNVMQVIKSAFMNEMRQENIYLKDEDVNVEAIKRIRGYEDNVDVEIHTIIPRAYSPYEMTLAINKIDLDDFSKKIDYYASSNILEYIHIEKITINERVVLLSSLYKILFLELMIGVFIIYCIFYYYLVSSGKSLFY